APHDMAGAALQPDIEFALSRRVIDHGRAVAIDGVELVGIDAAQYLLRVFGQDACEYLVDRGLTGISRGRQQVFPLDLALEVEGGATLDVYAVEFGGSGRNHRAIAPALTDSQVGHADVKPFIGRNIDVAIE